MRYPTPNHFRHHSRIYLALLAGVVVGALPIGGSGGQRISFGGITFFLFYLVSTMVLVRSLEPADLRKKASMEDEGIAVIVIITLAAVALSFVSLSQLLGRQGGNPWPLLLAIANVPLSWATLHMVMAFHYAHVFYTASEEPGAKRRDSRGLNFPATREPSILDFVYHAFVIGMTAQVSDVETESQEMRRATTLHSIVSFFFNTVILAFAVNVAAGH